MIHCPCCGGTMFENGTAQLEDELVCAKCGQRWAVASLEPVMLAVVDEGQRRETD